MLKALRILPLLLVPLTACDISTEPPPPQILWEATLLPGPSFPEVTGSAAAVTGPSGTDVSFKLTNIEPESTLAWRIRTGTCNEPGELVGSLEYYLDIVMPGGDGPTSFTLDVYIPVRLTEGNTYHLSGLTTGPEPDIIACGTFAQR